MIFLVARVEVEVAVATTGAAVGEEDSILMAWDLLKVQVEVVVLDTALAPEEEDVIVKASIHFLELARLCLI